MKNLLFVAALLLSFNIWGQDKLENLNIFVRVYDLQGNKINKGRVLLNSEKSLHLYRNNETIIIPVVNIGTIKTKRSQGNNILMGAVIGAIGGAIWGIATADPDAWMFGFTPAEGAVIGTLAGGFFGSLSGGISIPLKNSKSYNIKGDGLKLKAFKETITGIR